MDKQTFLAMLLIALSFNLLLGCISSDISQGGQSQAAQEQDQSLGAAQGSQDQDSSTKIIRISGNSFYPSSMTVQVGAKVRWINEDAAPHTIEADDRSNFASGVIPQNGFFEFEFKQAGTYTYHCGVHPAMRGAIQVQ